MKGKTPERKLHFDDFPRSWFWKPNPGFGFPDFQNSEDAAAVEHHPAFLAWGHCKHSAVQAELQNSPLLPSQPMQRQVLRSFPGLGKVLALLPVLGLFSCTELHLLGAGNSLPTCFLMGVNLWIISLSVCWEFKIQANSCSWSSAERCLFSFIFLFFKGQTVQDQVRDQKTLCAHPT